MLAETQQPGRLIYSHAGGRSDEREKIFLFLIHLLPPHAGFVGTPRRRQMFAEVFEIRAQLREGVT